MSLVFTAQAYAKGSMLIVHDQEMTIDYELDTRPTTSASSSQGRVYIGHKEWTLEGSRAKLTVTGAGCLSARLINIGSRLNSHGTLNIENGGKVLITNGNSYAYPLAVGGNGGGSSSENYTGSVGIINITGVGSELDVYPVNGEVAIGSTGGEGHVNISDGGRFIIRDGNYHYGLYIGSRGSTTSKGYVTVDGTGSELYSEARILLGTYNQGVLTVTNGATARTDSYISIGRVASIEGESLLSVSGAGSHVSAQDIYMSEGNYNQSALVVADDATLTVDNNIYITGTISASSELVIGARAGETAVGAGIINAGLIQFGKSGYTGDGKIIFNHTNDDYQFGVAINGRGAINVLNGNTELTADNSGFVGQFAIESAGTLTARQQHNLSNVKITNNGTLTLIGNNDWQLVNTLSGSGLINADTNGNEFSFAANTGDAFTGTVALNNTHFTLDALNAPQNLQFLQNTILQLNNNSVTTVARGAQSIGGLTFNGGLLKFDTTITPGDVISSNWVETDANSVLDISGTGKVQVTMPAVVPNTIPTINNNKSLLEQDDEQTLVMLIKANGSVSGTGGQLELIDENGAAITNAQLLDVAQNGNIVAKGTYDFQLSSGTNNDGLYVGYGLKELELLGRSDDALILTPTAGSTGLATDLRAKLTGSGDLAIEAAGQTVSLSNGGNDYTGETVVRQGTLSLMNDNVLGQTAHLQLSTDTQVLMNSYQQSVGKLSTVADSLVSLNEGSQLTISAAQRVNGDRDGGLISHNTLAGKGNLILDNSDVTVKGANEQYGGDVTLDNGSLLALNQVNGLGVSGNTMLANATDTLTFNVVETRALTHQFTRSLAGQGTVSLLDRSDITFNADNSTFSGLFNVAMDAKLRAASAQHLGHAKIANEGNVYLTANSEWALENVIYGTGNLHKQGAGLMTVNHDLTYTGNTTVEDGTLVIGDTAGSVGTLSGSTQVNVLLGAALGGNGRVAGQVDNAGTIIALNALSGYESDAASQFSIGGINNQGTIHLAGSSVGNRLVVDGNYVGQSGSELVIHTALGGDNSATDKLIIQGNSSGSTDLIVNNLNGVGDQTQNGIQVIRVDGTSDGEFKLANRAVAGAYEYLLHKNMLDNEDGNWYLRSTLEDSSNGSGTENDKEETPLYRPEAGNYIANMAAAKSMFNLRLEDREGRAENSSMWLRQYGSHNRQKDNTGQLRSRTNNYVVQGGGEILSHQFNEQDRFGVGVMLGYGHAASKTQSMLTGHYSKGRVNGYNAGLYATWYEDAITLNGTYIDSWVQYNWLNAEVNGEKLASESYNIDGLSASLEAGYRIWLGENREGNAYVTPQAQVIWNSFKADSHTEVNGTRVNTTGGDSLQTRLGMKLSLDGVHADDKAKARLFTIYTEANWIYNSKLTGVKMNGVPQKQSGNRNIGELKLGTEGKINRNLNLWANVAQQIGGNGYSDTAVNVGIKYRF